MLGFGIAVVYVLLVLFLRGSGARALFDLHALLMVLGGTIAAAAVSFTLPALMRMPQLVLIAGVGNFLDMPTVVAQLVKASDRVRMGGRAAAGGTPKEVDDAFLRAGLQYIVDGFEPTEIRQLMESDMHAIRARHRANISLFEKMGGFSPTFGILGTVEAMVAILGNLTTPDKLGPEIALAMIATLYGVAFANLLFHPIATRLRKMSEDELRIRQIMVEVIVDIQSGAKPEFIRTKLRVSLPPDVRRNISAMSVRRSKRNTQPIAPPMPEPEQDPEYQYQDEMVGAVPHDENGEWQ